MAKLREVIIIYYKNFYHIEKLQKYNYNKSIKLKKYISIKKV